MAPLVEWIFVARELHVALFFQNSKMAFASSKKIEQKILDVHNDVLYELAKIQLKYLVVLSVQK
jgi:hypothetical protein